MHDNKSDFSELLSRISHETAIPEWIIEKDYYITLLLKALANKFRDLVVAVRKDRMKSPVCYSAKAGVNPQDVLRKLVQENAFENDYKQVTDKLLLEKVSYEEAIRAITTIMDSGIFIFKSEQEYLS